jgi:hypothetical protein
MGADFDRKPLDEEMARKYKEAEHFRRIAFVGVVFSTIAVAVTIISVPMIYNYVQTVQSVLQSEMDFCKSRSGDLWLQMFKLKVIKGVPLDEERYVAVAGQLQEADKRFKRQPQDGYGLPPPPPATEAPYGGGSTGAPGPDTATGKEGTGEVDGGGGGGECKTTNFLALPSERCILIHF